MNVDIYHSMCAAGEISPDVEAAIKTCWMGIVGADCEVVVSITHFKLFIIFVFSSRLVNFSGE